MDDLEYRVGRLELGEGDILVVKIDAIVTRDLAERVRAHVKAAVPDHPVLVIDKPLDLSVLTRAQLTELVASPVTATEPPAAEEQH